jgi:hypothetical protein
VKRRPAPEYRRGDAAKIVELANMGWSGAGRAGGIVVQLRFPHNGRLFRTMRGCR